MNELRCEICELMDSRGRNCICRAMKRIIPNITITPYWCPIRSHIIPAGPTGSTSDPVPGPTAVMVRINDMDMPYWFAEPLQSKVIAIGKELAILGFDIKITLKL